jgi:hypothetical protein
VPITPSRKPSGIETMPGFDSGNQEKSAPVIIEVGEPDTTGEKITSTTAEIRPP